MKRRTSYLLLVLMLIGGAWYLTRHWQEFARFADFDPCVLLPLVPLHLAWLFSRGLVFKILVEQLGTNLSFTEYFGLTITTNFANYFVPGRLGALTKGVYLKKKMGVSYGTFAAYFFAQTVLVTISLVTCGIGAACVMVARSEMGLSDALAITLFFLLVLACMILALVVPVERLNRFEPVRKALSSLIDGWQLIRAHPVTSLKVVTVNLVGYMMLGLVVKLLFLGFRQEISYLTAFEMSIFLSLSSYFTLTPSNIGIQELLLGAISSQIGTGFESGLVAFGLNRLIQIAIVFPLAPVFTLLLTHRNTGTQSNHPAPR